jgi:hypothetical protein
MLEHRRLRPARSRDRSQIHAWVGEAAASAGAPMSLYSVTDERVLRDLAFPLVEPPTIGIAGPRWCMNTAPSASCGERFHRLLSARRHTQGGGEPERVRQQAETALTQLQQQISANQVGDRRRRSRRFGR